MGQSKNVKRSLILTLLTAAVSIALYISSTFAWVSDSLTSGNARIVGGSLDAKLEYRPAVADGAGYAQVTDATRILKEDSVWVPGHVEAYNLRISNVGSIALLYQLRIEATEENAGVDPEGQPLKLSELVKCAVLEGKQEFNSGIAAVAAVSGEPVSIGEALMTVQGMLEKSADREITLVLWMPDTLGDEMNYLSENRDPRLRLGVTMTATQLANDGNGSGQEAENTENTLL